MRTVVETWYEAYPVRDGVRDGKRYGIGAFSELGDLVQELLERWPRVDHDVEILATGGRIVACMLHPPHHDGCDLYRIDGTMQRFFCTPAVEPDGTKRTIIRPTPVVTRDCPLWANP